jgi:hypothetical protein
MLPDESIVSPKLSLPIGEEKVEIPPMEMPARFWKLGNVASASTPIRNLLGSK